MTDYLPTVPNSSAEAEKFENENYISRVAGVTKNVIYDVDLFHIPPALFEGVGIILAGSPAPGCPDGTYSHSFGARKMKTNAFNSLCWSTPIDAVAIMTYCPTITGKLEIYTMPPSKSDPRVILLANVSCRRYMPQSVTLDALSDERDIAIAMILPAQLVAAIVTDPNDLDKIDLTHTICNIFTAQGQNRKILTTSAFTAELERDLIETADQLFPAAARQAPDGL